MKRIDETIGWCGVDCGVCGDYTAGVCRGCRNTIWPAEDPCPAVAVVGAGGSPAAANARNFPAK